MKEEYGDQTVVHFLDGQSGKFDSDNWPLHLTLLTWFNVPDHRQDDLANELGIIARRWNPLEVGVEGEAMFGRHENVPVTLLGANALRAFHYNLINTIKSVGGTLRDDSFAGTRYRPHISHEYGRVATTAKKLEIGNFSIVEKIDLPEADREIVSTYRLEGAK